MGVTYLTRGHDRYGYSPSQTSVLKKWMGAGGNAVGAQVEPAIVSILMCYF